MSGGAHSRRWATPRPVRIRPPAAPGGKTARQRDILAFVRRYIVEHGTGPSYGEIAAGVGAASRGAIYGHVHNLIERGHLMRTGRYKARALALPDGPGAYRIALDGETDRALMRRAMDEGCPPEVLAGRLLALTLAPGASS